MANSFYSGTMECIHVCRDKNRKIVSYRLRRADGSQVDASPLTIKNEMFFGNLNVVNMKITSNGRLIVVGKVQGLH